MEDNGENSIFSITDFIDPLSKEYEIAEKYCTLDDFAGESVTIFDWEKTDRQTRFGKEAYRLTIGHGSDGRKSNVFTGARVVIQELKDIEKALAQRGLRTSPFRCKVLKFHHGYKLIAEN
jgi:hypothetical protein